MDGFRRLAPQTGPRSATGSRWGLGAGATARLARWSGFLRPSLGRFEPYAAKMEVTFLLLFLLFYIWFIEPRSLAYASPGFVLFFWLTLVSHWLHRDRAADLGLRLDTLPRALAEALAVIAPALLLGAVAGLLIDGAPRLGARSVTLAFLASYPWALFQQYGLQCFFAQRLKTVLRDRPRAIVCAALFATLHLPNPFLTVVTFGAGYSFCVLFRRCPNLFAISAAHALSATLLYHSLPTSITHLMRVGPGCFTHMGLF
jgi:Type II CAAX prenyl endopeptidase Rce1-like